MDGRNGTYTAKQEMRSSKRLRGRRMASCLHLCYKLFPSFSQGGRAVLVRLLVRQHS
jgi:hypothetical protein